MTRFLTLAALAAVTACSGSGDAASAADTGATASAAAATPQGADAQLADMREYRLTMDKIDRFMAAQRNFMQKAHDMTPAEREAARASSEAAGSANGTMDDMVRSIERQPVMLAAVREAGLSPREYTLIMSSMMQTAMAAGVAQSRPNDNQDSLIRAMQASPENVKFYRANEAEIARRQKELEALAKRLGVDDS
jgi:hypothetical protein